MSIDGRRLLTWYGALRYRSVLPAYDWRRSWWMALGVVLFVAGTASAADLEFAHGLYRQGRYPLAAEEYQACLGQATDPGTKTQAMFFLAECYIQLGRGADAKPLVEQVVAETLKSPELLDAAASAQAAFRHGQLAFEQRSFAEASERIASYLTRFPAHPLRTQATYFLAESLIEQGRLDDADTTLAGVPNDADPKLFGYLTLSRGKLAERRDQWKEASAIYSTLTSADDRVSATIRAEGFYRLGSVAMAEKAFDRAADVFEEGRRHADGQPSLVSMMLQEASCRLQLDQTDKALALLQSIVDEHPDHPAVPQALMLIVRGYARGADWTLSKPWLNRLERDFGQTPWLDRTLLILSDSLAGRDPSEALPEMESLLTKARGEESKERLAYSAGLVAYRASAATRAAELLVPILTSKDTNLARDARYALGLVRGKEGRWEESAALLEPLLEEELPLETARGVLMHLAESLARLEADESQTRRWKEFVDVVARRNADLLVDVGNRAYDRDRPAWAALAFDRRLETAADPPQRLPALLGAGWSWYQVGDRSQAAARFTQAAETAAAGSAEQAEALSMLATIAQADGDSSRALRLFRRVHEEFPTSPFAGSAARKAAKILSEMGNANDADALYQNLADRLAAGPERARVSYERAWLAMDRNDLAAAEQYFLQSVTEAGPGSIAVESALKLAEICQQRGKLPEAKEFLDRAESLGPGDELLPAVAYRRGLLERAMGHDESARSALRQLVDRWPDSSFAAASLYTLGELAFESESPDDAMADFQRLIALPTAGKYGPLAQLRLAQVHLKRSRWDDADQEAAKLAEDSVDRPVREEAVYVRARVLQQRADFDKARELYRSIIGPERTETAAKAQFMIGETYFFQERFDDALKELLKVEILYPIPEWQSLALLEVGKCHDRKGERDAARKAYEDVVTKYGQQPAAAEAKRLLESTTQRAEVKPTP